MPVFAVVNRKGGSGKSTIATNLAAFCAQAGCAVMLGDTDKQQSSRLWLRLRDASLAFIHGWCVDARQILRPPKNVKHVILDTPGGLHGLDLARIVLASDVILIPVCGSIFDRDSAAACLLELRAQPRIKSGRCKVGLIGMRVDSWSSIGLAWQDWAKSQEVPILGVISPSLYYAQCLEAGRSIFDLPIEETLSERAEWQSILSWLGPYIFAGLDDARVAAPTKSSVLQAMPHGAVLKAQPTLPPVAVARSLGAVACPPSVATSRLGALMKIPNFLRKL